MTITGNNKNHVIAWGGGFNIAKGETVEFAKGGKAFLNLDYTNKASRILGNLNGNDNNVYLVNPSGVLIGAGASVNANRFVASTTNLDKALKDFTNNSPDDKNAANFSPVFSRNLQGNIVNMGNIKANYITLVGNEVRNLASQNESDINGTRGTFTPKDSNINSKVHLIGKKIFLDADGAVNMKNIEVTGFNPLDGKTNPDITVQMAMSTFASKKHNIDNWIQQTYTTNGIDRGNGSMYVHNIITIGVAGGWNDFANAWNNDWGITRQIEEFKLIGNLDFKNSPDFVSVGTAVNSGFNKIFNGNGYTMSNITLNDGDASNNGGTIIAGIFNKVGGGTIKNLTIDRVTADISQKDILHLGGFAGQINGGKIENVTVNNINLNGTINNTGYVGGFAGVINGGNISNVTLNNINNLYLYGTSYIGSTMNLGGFAGRIANGTINNAILNKIGTFRSDVITQFGTSNNTVIGGFTTEIASGKISDIFLYYNEDSKFMPSAALQGNKDSRNQIATFYHSNQSGNLNNIYIAYNTHITDKNGFSYILDPGFNKDPNTGRIYYTAKGMIEGIKQVKDADKDKYGSAVRFREYMLPKNDSYFQNDVVKNHDDVKVNGDNYFYSWVTPVKNSNVFGDAHNNTSGDYTTLINTYLPQIIDDILEADYGVTIENEKGTSTQATLNTIINQLNNILNAINKGEGEGAVDGTITNFLKQILVGKGQTDAELANQIESIKQSINFLRAFYDGYNGSKDNAVTQNQRIFNSFASNTNYTEATNKYTNAIKGGMTNLRNTIDGQLDNIAKLEDTLTSFKEALKKAEELNNQGKDLNTQVENIKNQVAGLDNEIANLQKMISEMEQSGLIPPDRIAAVKAQLAAKKQERSNYKTQVANIIDQIKGLKDTDLANLIKEVDGYVTTINDIRNGFINDLKINQAQDIDVMAGGAKGSFTYYGVETMAQNNIKDNINVPLPVDSIPLIPLEPSKPVDPNPNPNTDPNADPNTDLNPNPNPDPNPDPNPNPNPDPSDPDNGGGDNGDNGYEGDDTVNNNSGYDARLAYLNYKREVLELPAEEETSIEINEGREKGRLCIVSDNAKTNNPCMAITY